MIGNDVSSRDIEGANPLYLPQAKVFAAACAIGPAVYVPEDWEAPLEISLTIRDADGAVLFAGETSTARMKRTFTDLVGWLIRDNPVPPGSVLLTGTGLVPPDDFTLLPGHVVEIHVPEIGTLTNPVVLRRRPAREELPMTEIPSQDAPPWLSASSSPASSAASAPGSRAACSTTATTSSATTSATPAIASSSCSATTSTGSRSSRATSRSSPRVERALDEHEITRVVHLAALQVPFVRANPPLGMHVNVAGTVNVFDAVSRRLDRIPGVMYASSSAIYNASDPSPAPETGGTSPSTLYGVSKLADEGIARVYRADAGVSSIGLRPYVVYGLGRDQGMTSGPTAAMLAAARGEAAHIGFSGVAQYDYAPDVARAAVTAAHSSAGGAAVYNTPGARRRCRRRRRRDPGVRAGGRDHLERRPAAVPAELEAVGFDRDVGPFPRTPLADGSGGDDRALPAALARTTG